MVHFSLNPYKIVHLRWVSLANSPWVNIQIMGIIWHYYDAYAPLLVLTTLHQPLILGVALVQQALKPLAVVQHLDSNL